ncbi:MAG: oligosaccharide flippase family protein [candidate division KSB1 bacterium]|nr:oligosaccharide flippase family protein [candidate division KSB1 bacterium]
MIKSEFGKNVLKLISGTAAAHMIAFLLTPVLTRLYGKVDLGYWQLFVSTITTLGVVASLKLETAVVLPENEREAESVIAAAVAATLAFVAVLTLVLSIWGRQFLKMMKAEPLVPYKFALSLGVLLFAWVQLLQSILVRKKLFGVLALNKIIQIGSSMILAIALGLLYRSFRTLLITQLLGYALAGAALYRLSRLTLFLNFTDLKRTFIAYKKFPTVNTATFFLNTFSLQLPVFMLSRYFGAEQVALYSMANQMMNVPLFMIGSSVHQVYYQKAAEAYHRSADELAAVYKSTVKKLAIIGLAPVIVILAFGPLIASLYFGKSYMETGIYMRIITFWMYFQFINSPISGTFIILDRQEIGFILVAVSIIIRFAVMAVFHQSPRAMIAALSAAAGLFYLFYNLSIYYYIRRARTGKHV